VLALIERAAMIGPRSEVQEPVTLMPASKTRMPVTSGLRRREIETQIYYKSRGILTSAYAFFCSAIASTEGESFIVRIVVYTNSQGNASNVVI
jgi:hypothetical protein